MHLLMHDYVHMRPHFRAEIDILRKEEGIMHPVKEGDQSYYKWYKINNLNFSYFLCRCLDNGLK